jgi:hypothetical protein
VRVAAVHLVRSAQREGRLVHGRLVPERERPFERALATWREIAIWLVRRREQLEGLGSGLGHVRVRVRVRVRARVSSREPSPSASSSKASTSTAPTTCGMPARRQWSAKLRSSGPMAALPKVRSKKRGRPAGTAARSAASSVPSKRGGAARGTGTSSYCGGCSAEDGGVAALVRFVPATGGTCACALTESHTPRLRPTQMMSGELQQPRRSSNRRRGLTGLSLLLGPSSGVPSSVPSGMRF